MSRPTEIQSNLEALRFNCQLAKLYILFFVYSDKHKEKRVFLYTKGSRFYLVDLFMEESDKNLQRSQRFKKSLFVKDVILIFNVNLCESSTLTILRFFYFIVQFFILFR